MPQWALLIRPVAHVRRRQEPRGWRGGLDGVGCRRCAGRSCGRRCHNCAVCAASGNNNNNNKDHLDCLICYVCVCDAVSVCMWVCWCVCLPVSMSVFVCLADLFVRPKSLAAAAESIKEHMPPDPSLALSPLPQTQLTVMKIFSIRQRQT